MTRTRDITARRRTLIQSAKLAISDVYDAIVELVTNADDRYQLLQVDLGRIEIDVERRRNEPQVLAVRDFADGMDSATMDKKLGYMGDRVSGLEKGLEVRGTNSRGAKDVAALGQVTFESIAADGQLHRCRITPWFKFELDPPEPIPNEVRERLGIPDGTGTVVSIDVDQSHTVPLHDTLRSQVGALVPLRDIIRDPKREVILRDRNQDREHLLEVPSVRGKERVKTRLSIPGYPKADPKLIILRASEPFDRVSERFRLGGILVKSSHAIHESTLFDPQLERDPHALRFYGRLTCPYIDDLWREFDEQLEREEEPRKENPIPIIDPSRKSGLMRRHPFVERLSKEVLKRLMPLVEEERQREEHERATVANKATKRRLKKLQDAASKFMGDAVDEGKSDVPGVSQRLLENGYHLTPPYTQIIKGHSRDFTLRVLKDRFPEVEEGTNVQVACLTQELKTDQVLVALEADPENEDILHGSWKITGVEPTKASGVTAVVGPIESEATVEVLESEKSRYSDIGELQFQHGRYRIKSDKKRKKVRLYAPIDLTGSPDFFFEHEGFEISGAAELKPRDDLGISMAEFEVKTALDIELTTTLRASLNGKEVRTKISLIHPLGSGIEIKIEDIDLKHTRYRWVKNTLEIAARHPSLSRYLGSKVDGFPGQESKHFRALMAEIVSEAVCFKLVSNNIEANPFEYEDADWDYLFDAYSRLMTRFLPQAHKLVVPNPS